MTNKYRNRHLWAFRQKSALFHSWFLYVLSFDFLILTQKELFTFLQIVLKFDRDTKKFLSHDYLLIFLGMQLNFIGGSFGTRYTILSFYHFTNVHNSLRTFAPPYLTYTSCSMTSMRVRESIELSRCWYFPLFSDNASSININEDILQHQGHKVVTMKRTS